MCIVNSAIVFSCLFDDKALKTMNFVNCVLEWARSA
jgi:hypothetical protein